jgi:RNA polymerase sigma-54 factor
VSAILPEEPVDDTPVDDTGAASSDPYNDSQFETTAARSRDDGETDWTEWTEATPTLHDHLQGQLQLCNLSPRDRALCQLLIEGLDDDGYLRQSFEELAPLFHAEFLVDEVEWNAALKLVQFLEPAGIGARDLRECLLTQLSAADCTPEQVPARRAIVDHLQSLGRQDWSLERWLEASPSKCEPFPAHPPPRPHPGWRFGRPDTRYIVPDVIVHKSRAVAHQHQSGGAARVRQSDVCGAVSEQSNPTMPSSPPSFRRRAG